MQTMIQDNGKINDDNDIKQDNFSFALREKFNQNECIVEQYENIPDRYWNSGKPKLLTNFEKNLSNSYSRVQSILLILSRTTL